MSLPETLPLAESLERLARCPRIAQICFNAREQEMACFEAPPSDSLWRPVGVAGFGLGRIEIVWGSEPSWGASFPLSPPEPAEAEALMSKPSLSGLPDMASPGPQAGRSLRDAEDCFESFIEESGGHFYRLRASNGALVATACPHSAPIPADPESVILAYLAIGGASFTEIHSAACPERPLPSMLANDQREGPQGELPYELAQGLWEAALALREAFAIESSLPSGSRAGAKPPKPAL